MHIRTASPDDADEISALIEALSDPFYLHPSRSGAELFLASVSSESIRAYVSAANFFYQVAVAETAIAGIVAVRDNSHLFHLFVATPFQRQGLGHRLWSTAKAHALSAGNTGEFTVNSSLGAVPVYEKFSFARSGEVQGIHGISFQPMRLKSPAQG